MQTELDAQAKRQGNERIIRFSGSDKRYERRWGNTFCGGEDALKAGREAEAWIVGEDQAGCSSSLERGTSGFERVVER